MDVNNETFQDDQQHKVATLNETVVTDCERVSPDKNRWRRNLAGVFLVTGMAIEGWLLNLLWLSPSFIEYATESNIIASLPLFCGELFTVIGFALLLRAASCRLVKYGLWASIVKKVLYFLIMMLINFSNDLVPFIILSVCGLIQIYIFSLFASKMTQANSRNWLNVLALTYLLPIIIRTLEVIFMLNDDLSNYFDLARSFNLFSAYIFPVLTVVGLWKLAQSEIFRGEYHDEPVTASDYTPLNRYMVATVLVWAMTWGLGVFFAQNVSFFNDLIRF